MPGYAHAAEGVPLSRAFLANTLAVAVFLVMLPFGGMLSDRFGRKPTMLAFAIGFLALSWPAFQLIGGGFWSLLLVELVGMFFLVGYSANCAVVMAEQFPAEVRTTGIGLPYALAVAALRRHRRPMSPRGWPRTATATRCGSTRRSPRASASSSTH